MKNLFVKGENSLTADDVDKLIIHSERGSNAFQEECLTLAFWQDYLQDAECKFGIPDSVTTRHYYVNCFGCIIVVHDTGKNILINASLCKTIIKTLFVVAVV